MVRRRTRWRVGNGRLIHIWDDKWLSTPTTYKVVSPPQNFDNFPMVSTPIDCDSRRWKVDLLKSLFLPFETRTILNIPISYNLPNDKIIWVGNNRGVFTVKSTYYVTLNMVESSEEGESSYNDSRDHLWKKIWHLHIPSNVRIFAWRACVDALPTMVNLQKRSIGENDLCPCCGFESKTLFHSIIKCEVARRVWEN